MARRRSVGISADPQEDIGAIRRDGPLGGEVDYREQEPENNIGAVSSDGPLGASGGDPNYPVPFQDYQPDEYAGNQDSARELFGGRSPTTPAVRQSTDPVYGGTSGLPQGMTVEHESDGGYGGDEGGQSAFSTPSMPHEPSPISGMTANPQTAAGTRRVSSPGSQSALFSEASGGTPLFGRAGGLMGGGKGVPGGNEGGPSATENMLALLRMFRNGVE